MEDSERPIIKLKLTGFDLSVEVIGVLLLIAFWIFTIYHFAALPEIIPTHFGGGGKPDGYGSKWTIFSLPVVGLVMHVGLTMASRYPHKMNYMTTITPENAEKQYSIMARMIRVMKVSVLLVFFIIDYEVVQVASGLPDIFGKYFLLIVTGLVYVPLFYFLIQSSKNA